MEIKKVVAQQVQQQMGQQMQMHGKNVNQHLIY
jgi:hypothetical protein